MADADDLMQELCGVSLSAMDSSQNAAEELMERRLLAVERAVLESDVKSAEALQDGDNLASVLDMAKLVCDGEYADVIRLPQAQKLLQSVSQFRSEEHSNKDEDMHICGSIALALQSYLLDQCDSAESRLVGAYEILFVGVAFFDMYVQANYTGPAFEKETLRDVLDLVTRLVNCSTESNDKKTHSEALVALQVDGESPFSICEYPQFLLVGRCLLDFVGNHAYNDWSVAANEVVSGQNDNEVSDDVVEGPAKRQITGGAAIRALGEMLDQIKSASWWNARATVAHERLLLAKQPSNTLWFEARRGYIQTLKTAELFAFEKDTQYLLARAYVEWGLAQHHFDKNKHGKSTFARAKEISGVSVQLSGSMGKRTKFQQKSVAQMVLLAASKKEPTNADEDASVYATAVAESTHVDFGGKQVTTNGEGESSAVAAAPPADGLTAEEEHIQKLVQEGEASYRNVNLDQVDQDNYLLESIAFEDRKLTEQGNLQIVDQIVLLGLCLDVKNSNANDGLTREEMMPYVTRVLENPNNWMVYSTALLERAWLECESSKRRERAVLQMQALVDQHTTRLTITQNTLESIADSAPARERMRFVYSLAFPPRYALKRDLAERYFKLGVLGSAVEICEELEMWDDVVKCYQILDKPMRAEKLVRERLDVAPTPFMWVTLGDLTQDPSHYETSWTLSKQRFARAKRSLGRYYFEKGDHEAAIPHYEDA
ncbi:Tetratricopeptide repeat protein, partial [Phytophthora palmivora]